MNTPTPLQAFPQRASCLIRRVPLTRLRCRQASPESSDAAASADRRPGTAFILPGFLAGTRRACHQPWGNEMRTQRILVTGGGWVIGTHLANELRSRGHDVLAAGL